MLRIVFMGTPEFAVPTLSAILAAGHTVAQVYTRAPQPAGRGMAERRSPVHVAAERAGIPVSTPKSLRPVAEQDALRALEPDVVVVVAYGLILPKAILDIPRWGCLNLHGSALPRWRGAAPIQRAVMAGDTETAAMVMRMDEGLDTGPICLTGSISIGPDMTAGDLHDRMAAEGAPLVVQALSLIERGALHCAPQPTDGVTYAAKIEKGETHIDFARPASDVHNHLRGLSPFPGAWFEIEIGGKVERIKALRSVLTDGQGDPGTILDEALSIACGRGAVRLTEVQRAGKRPQPAADLLRGLRVGPGCRVLR